MKNDIAQALLLKVLEGTSAEEIEDMRKYFKNMARYKYDDYQQYSPGKRFLESLALWLNQFKETERITALKFIRQRLIFISQSEMHLLASAAFSDQLRERLIQDISVQETIPSYKVNKIVETIAYRKLLRQALFCGMSDGARIEIFRRANTGVISHEQIYQTYELSTERASKMQEELVKDMKKIVDKEYVDEEDTKFKRVFLLDDFSASGTSYLKFETNGDIEKGKGKIAAFYKSIFKEEEFKKIFNIGKLKVYVVIYLCSEQARNQIEKWFSNLEKEYGNKPELICLHLIPNTDKLSRLQDAEILKLCESDDYYDSDELEDEHTRKGGDNVKLGFGKCALPLVLAHNTPNNSIPLLWSYDTSDKFVGLFPRIPRHKEL